MFEDGLLFLVFVRASTVSTTGGIFVGRAVPS